MFPCAFDGTIINEANVESWFQKSLSTFIKFDKFWGFVHHVVVPYFVHLIEYVSGNVNCFLYWTIGAFLFFSCCIDLGLENQKVLFSYALIYFLIGQKVTFWNQHFGSANIRITCNAAFLYLHLLCSQIDFFFC